MSCWAKKKPRPRGKPTGIKLVSIKNTEYNIFLQRSHYCIYKKNYYICNIREIFILL